MTCEQSLRGTRRPAPLPAENYFVLPRRQICPNRTANRGNANHKSLPLMQTTRRQFIKSGLGCALGMTLSRMTSTAALSTKKIPIGFQLYTVRGEFSRNAPATLKALGSLGYQGVEFWGYDGTPNVYQQYSAADLRKLLDEHDLKCCGMHLNLKALAKENLERTIEINRIFGSPFLNVAAAKEKMGSGTSIAELADF